MLIEKENLAIKFLLSVLDNGQSAPSDDIFGSEDFGDVSLLSSSVHSRQARQAELLQLEDGDVGLTARPELAQVRLESN